jgi:large subunit ribosomal protein L23
MTLHPAEVILRPVISEKSMDLTQPKTGRGEGAAAPKYTFAVHDDANKHQIKDAVEQLFRVRVTGVNVLTTRPKEKRRNTRRGRTKGYTSSWRKAVVTLAVGEKIEFFEGV